MRATEALHLSNPETILDKDTSAIITHLDTGNQKTWDMIKEARKANRKMPIREGWLF